MYESFYHLSANPFRLTPDPRFCFSHSTYQESHAYLQYAIELGEGFILLTGRPGAGKTTLIQSFLGSLDVSRQIAARIAVTDFEATELLRAVAYNFGIDGEDLGKATLLLRIEQFFITQVQAGRRVLLVIDEAQRLSRASLEELRLLADLQLGINPLLQIFLVGQDALRDVMNDPDMEQLQQRVIGACRLDPLSVRETRSYIEHRLRQAGWQGAPELTGGAVLAVYEYSQGVPRHINKICTRLLLQGFMEKKHTLDTEDVQRVAGELGKEQLAPLSGDSAVGELSNSGPTSPRGSVPELSELAVRADSEPGNRAVSRGGKRGGKGAGSRATAVPAGQAINRPDDKRVTGMRPRAGPADNDVSAQTQTRQSRVYPDAPEALFSALFKAVGQRVTGAGLARLLSAKARLGGQPVVLLSLVAVVVLSVGAVTFRFANSDAVSALSAQSLRLPVPDSTTPAPEVAGKVAESEAVQELPAETGMPAGLDRADAARPPRRSAGGEVIANAQPSGPAAGPTRESAAEHEAAPESLQLPAGSGQTAWHAAATPADSAPATENGVAAHASPATVPSADNVTAGYDDSATAPSAESVTAGSAKPVPPIEDLAAASAKPAPAPPIEDVTAASANPAATPPVAVAEDDSTDSSVAAASGAATTASGLDIRPASGRPASALATVETGADAPVAEEDELLPALLAKAELALGADRLLIPADNNAYTYYREALRLDPGNTQAKNGINRIVSRYTALAGAAIRQGDTAGADRYIDRGLRVRPGDERLLAMRGNLKVLTTSVVEPEVLPQELPPPVLEEPAKPGFLQRFKALFAEPPPTPDASMP